MNTTLFAPQLFEGTGGIERMLRLYLRALSEAAAAADRVRLVVLNDATVSPADLDRYSARSLDSWTACKRSKRAFLAAGLRAAVRSDLIVCGHAALLPVAWAGSLLNRRLRYVLVAHGIEVWRPFPLWERRALAGAWRILCVSAFTRSRLLERLPLRPECLVVVPNALDPGLDPGTVEPPPSSSSTILAVSRLSKLEDYKGIDHLIDAMPAVLRQVPPARLRIIGRGEALEDLQERARLRGVAGSVEFRGFVADADMHAEFAACRLFALPSEKEGFGLVYLEALAHGRPCLAADAGGAPEVVSPQTGILVPYGDVAAIASGLVKILRTDWPLAPLLERAASFSYLRFKERLASVILR